MNDWTFATGGDDEDLAESLIVSDGGDEEDRAQRRRHGDELHSTRLAQSQERHGQRMRHADDLHRQHLKQRDELHRHNLGVAKAQKRHLGEAYLYSGGMAYNAVDKDPDDAPAAAQNSQAPDTGTAAGATTGGAGATAGGAGTGGGTA